MTLGTHKTIFNSNFVELGLHVLYRGPLYDNGTSNALLIPLMTELSTLGRIFGLRRQNSIIIRSWLKKIFFGRKWLTP